MTEPIMFADDTSLTATGQTVSEIEYKLGIDIVNVKTWLDANKLTLNKGKTEYMLIGSRKRLEQLESEPVIKIGDHAIKRVYKKKVLGVIIEDKLQWAKHVDEQCKKISCSIVVLRKVKPYVPQATLVTIYKTFVLPYFNYCSTVWHDGNQANLTKMAKFQKRPARVITGLGYEERSSNIF